MHLDREPQPLAIAAHPGQGWVTVLVASADGEGELIMTDGLGRPKTRTLTGVVTLVPIKE